MALVVGNSDYEHGGDLPNAVNDAQDIAEVIRGLKDSSGKALFDVVRLQENRKRADLMEDLASLAEEGEKGGLVVFFYAGHGLVIDGENYLQPVDANVSGQRRLYLLLGLAADSSQNGVLLGDDFHDGGAGSSSFQGGGSQQVSSSQKSRRGALAERSLSQGRILGDSLSLGDSLCDSLCDSLRASLHRLRLPENRHKEKHDEVLKAT